jgi:hypothetical protein
LRCSADNQLSAVSEVGTEIPGAAVRTGLTWTPSAWMVVVEVSSAQQLIVWLQQRTLHPQHD